MPSITEIFQEESGKLLIIPYQLTKFKPLAHILFEIFAEKISFWFFQKSSQGGHNSVPPYNRTNGGLYNPGYIVPPS